MTSAPISDKDDAATFDSGEPTLDDYLRTRALANHVGGASRCFVTCRDGDIVGYYALASGAVSHSNPTGKFRRNMPDPIPVILLSRLAIDRKHHGRGLEENLLRVKDDDHPPASTRNTTAISRPSFSDPPKPPSDLGITTVDGHQPLPWHLHPRRVRLHEPPPS